MTTKTLPVRNEIPTEYKWNLEAVYPEDVQWESEYAELGPLLEEIKKYRGRLGEGGDTLLAALNLKNNINERIERLFTYARMRRDEDNTNSHYQALTDRARAIWVRSEETTAFFNPELLAAGRETIERLTKQTKGLELYSHLFDDLFRAQEHMLNEQGESLLAAAGEVASAPGQIYEMLTDADMKFGTITDEEGQEVELTQGRYVRYIRSYNRNVREQTFKSFHIPFDKQRNTIASCYASQVKSDIFSSRARKFNSSLEAALFQDNIPASVYENLIQAVHNNMDLMYRYMDLRKRLLKLPKLHMYDLHVPLVSEVNESIEYGRATEMVTEAFAPLGEQYQEAVKEGFRSRWTDVYETPNKTSGAYSWGVYGVHPFMLLNYQDTLRDVFTLAHETGHSIHTYYSYRKQPYLYSGYSLFVAEVASTLNEELLTNYLLKSTDDRDLKRSVINNSLEQFRGTLYRQTMFAEFEKLAHEHAEAGEALTSESLSKMHYDLNVLYHGDNVDVDEEVAIEWARIPHFYRSFYVYKYATGISAAVALSQQILNEGQPAVDRYLRFLSSGGSDYSINLLRDAGVDMTAPTPVDQALKLFGQRIGEMEELL